MFGDIAECGGDFVPLRCGWKFGGRERPSAGCGGKWVGDVRDGDLLLVSGSGGEHAVDYGFRWRGATSV